MDKKSQKFIAKLRKARTFIERGWTQGQYARDASGKSAWPTDYFAVRWCLGGALYCASPKTKWLFVDPANGGIVHMPDWNDAPERTQADVLACIDNSIAALVESK